MSTKKTSPKAPAKKAAKPRKRAAAKKRASTGHVKRISDIGREMDQRRKGRRIGVLEAIGKMAEFVGAAIAIALVTPEEAVRAAGGSTIEAMWGHKCGPDCWHAPDGTAEEKQAWWDKRLADFDARLLRRQDGSVRTDACAQASAEASRCQAMHQTTPEVQQGIKVPHGIPTQCVHSTGHKGAHQNAAWRDGKPGGVSWWS